MTANHGHKGENRAANIPNAPNIGEHVRAVREHERRTNRTKPYTGCSCCSHVRGSGARQEDDASPYGARFKEAPPSNAAFEERAAILEFDGGLSREEAEELAATELGLRTRSGAQLSKPRELPEAEIAVPFWKTHYAVMEIVS